MSNKSNELEQLLSQSGKILQQMQGVAIGAQIIGSNNTTNQSSGKSIAPTTKENLKKLLSLMHEQTLKHQDEIPDVQEMLVDIQRVSKELEKDIPDTPSILARVRDIVKVVATVSALYPLAKELLETTMSVVSSI